MKTKTWLRPCSKLEAMPDEKFSAKQKKINYFLPGLPSKGGALSGH
jgi:hypothetical protein